MTALALTRLTAGGLLLLAASSALSLLDGDPLRLVLATPAGIDVGVHLDVLGTVLLAYVAALAWVLARYAGRNLAGQRRTRRFAALHLLALLSLALLVTGASLPVMALGWTVSGLAVAALVQHTGSARAVRAAGYVRRRLLLGDAALWLGVGLAVALLPSVDRAELSQLSAQPAPGPWAVTLVALLLLVACVVRSALWPLHRWLPETAEAPSPVSALLHAGVVNGAGVLVALAWPLFRAAPGVLLLLLLLGAASVAAGTVGARLRSDVKGRLACSTTAQMGWMAVQLGLGLPAAAVLHLVGHGSYKSWLFLRAGGTVSRLRWRPTADGTDLGTGASTGTDLGGPATVATASRLVPAVAAAAIALVVGAPALAQMATDLGPVVAAPTLLMLATTTVAVLGAGRAGAPAGRLVPVVALVGLSGAAYLWALRALEGLLAPALPPAPVWPVPVAVALVGGLVALAALLLAVFRGPGLRTTADLRPGRVAVLASGSALPPWARHVGGRAAWPALVPTATDGPATPSAADRAADRQVLALVAAASDAVSPAWPLRTMVAANPLAEHEPLGFEAAGARAADELGARWLLPMERYARLHDEGRITREHLAAAVRDELADPDGGVPPDEGAVQRRVEELVGLARRSERGTAPPASSRLPLLSELAEAATAREGERSAEGGRGSRPGAGATTLREVVEEHAHLWTQRAWARAEAEEAGPWRLWRAHAAQPSYDRALRLPGAAALVADLPLDAAAALDVLLDRVGMTDEHAVAYLRSVMAAGPGWTAHARWRGRLRGSAEPLVQLLALRVALDVLVAGSRSRRLARPALPPGSSPAPAADGGPPRDPRATWQLAYELGYQQPLLARLAGPAARLAGTTGGEDATAQAQVVTCIDVRSERLRRHLESVGPYDTVGFAGFFGVDLAVTTGDGARFEQCPALLRPGHTATSAPPSPDLRTLLREAVVATADAPLTPLLLAEAGGVLAGAGSVGRTAAPRAWGDLARRWDAAPDPWGGDLTLGMDVTTQAVVAGSALRGMGLVDGFAPLLVLCGHAATMQNNAFATAYDCGACGGNGGQVNARALARMLGDPAVRELLAIDGLVLPDTTWVVAAVHCTTTDTVVLDPHAEVPASHEPLVRRLQADLAEAGDRVRTERLATLPGGPGRDGSPGVGGATARRHLHARAEDWSQAFPEWGLAGNAALVVGPRELTRGLDLDGRVFLHSYDPAIDGDGTVLETLLTAPLVVTQWINSQYYASTVDPDVLGAGDKTSHNVVGDVGVLTGAHGDLRLGLPWQALFTGDPHGTAAVPRHEPLRLLAVVWAAPEAVAAVVARHAGLRDLVRGGWVRLVSVDPRDGQARRLDPGLAWRAAAVAPWPTGTVPAAAAGAAGP